MTGYELARAIRQDPTCNGTTLVAITAYGNDSDKARAHEAGFDFHLVKPLEFPELDRLLLGLMNKKNRKAAN